MKAIDALEKRDKIIIGTGIVLGFIGAALAQIGVVGLPAELVLTYAMVLPILPALYFLYKARGLWGGEMARYLDFIGIGLLINLLLFPIHMSWHFSVMGGGGGLPAWGISSSFWYIFFHGMTGYSFAMLAYGFYLFYESGAE